VDFTYALDGPGWATATLALSDQSVSMTVSYLHDSLREVAASIVRLRAGESEAKVIFMDEPGEHHLILKRVGVNVNLEVIWFDDWASWKITPDTEPRSMLTATVPLVEFHHAVTNALAGLLDAFGLEGYKKKWIEHEFPLEEFETLRAS
jgi:hypothetical protein